MLHMDANSLKWLGTVGFWAIEASYVPQITRLYRMKEAEEFSMIFPALNLAGRVLVLIYSLVKGDHVVMWGVTLGIVLRAVLLGEVFWYRVRRRAQLRLQDETISI